MRRIDNILEAIETGDTELYWLQRKKWYRKHNKRAGRWGRKRIVKADITSVVK